MIQSRTAAGGFVCLRCRLQPLPAKAQWRPVAAYCAQLRASSTAADERPEDGAPERGTSADETSTTDGLQARPRVGRPYSKVYHNRGTRIKPVVKGLAFDVLGQRGEALVMKDLGKGADRSLPVLKPADPDPEAATDLEGNQEDIWGFLQEPAGAATEAEVQAHLDELRPESRIITQRDFDALADMIKGGFTIAQLVRYIGTNRTDGVAPESQGTPHVDPDAPWILTQNPWVPQDPTAQQRAITPKQALVGQLMRRCWGISIQEQMDGPGYLDVHLRDPEFSLLLVGNRRWLRVLARVYLRKVGGRIEIRRSGRLLRICGLKAVAETLLADTNQILRTVVTETLDLGPLTKRTIPRESLERLGQVTGSYIHQHDAATKLSVSWINRPQSNQGSPFETTRDVVFRNLVDAYGRDAPSLSPPSAVVPHLQPEFETGRLVLQSGLDEHTLPWHVPTGSWARFVRPIPSATAKLTDEPLPPDPLPSDLVSWLIRPKTPGSQPSSPQSLLESGTDLFGLSSAGPWALAKTSTHAVFGHLLHRTEESNAVSQPCTAIALHDCSPRLLSTPAPPLFGQAFSKDAAASSLNTQLVVRLVPKPDASAAVHAPALELRVRMNNNMVADIKSLRALHHTHSFDLLLPDRPVDARITQRHISELLRQRSNPLLEQHPFMQPLVDFLGRSEISPMENIFRTPALVKGMTVPVRAGHAAACQNTDESGLLTIDYLFAGLELRHNAVLYLYSRSLAYVTRVDASGTQRVELSMQASSWREPDPFIPGSQDKAEEFVADVLRVARGDRVQWFL